ncbi:tRNA 2-thiouridine(34) synthase MnmA [Patescibacteria group bacterium]|nr:tRNA 2-thiouridine(34) synthase MnmA [Patescibacteria group bacterium]
MIKKTDKILVALSGGVDSAVVLYLLKKQGYDVSAAFMKNFSEKVNIKGDCPWKEDRLMAYRVATYLKIPIQTFDFQKQYHDKIVDYIFKTYQKGQTPNPDVLCNNEIKFKLFLEQAKKLGFDKIATGHYAQIKEDKNGYHLLRGKDPNKDQSYFLSGLTQEQLSQAIFPIGDIIKSEVRHIAKRAKLPNAEKKDSQGICFIGKIDLKTFLQQKIKSKIGDIVDTKGNKLGTHPGVWYFTIGQRRGLDLAGGPWYVAKKNIKNNQLIVAKGDDEELLTKTVQISAIHWLAKEYKLPLKTKAQIRYRQAAQNVTLYKDKVIFKTGQKGVASGQILAVYQGRELIASANII